MSVFGPSQAAARIESSKVFAKDLMARHGIPTAAFRVFTRADAARAYCRELGAPVVVKADGLAAGKGAIVCASLDEADRAVALCLEDGAFGEAGRAVVVEEFMRARRRRSSRSPTASPRCPSAPLRTTRRSGTATAGPIPAAWAPTRPRRCSTPRLQERTMAEIVRPTIAALAKEGCPYQGVLYVGLMITRAGPRVVEFNCRFGDPECQAILPRLDQDLLPVLEAVAAGRGLPASLAWRHEASVCVVAASGGYPGPYDTGVTITGVEEAGRLPA